MRKSKILAILGFIAALATAAVALLDENPLTTPDITEVIDAGTGVVNEFQTTE